MILRAFFNPSEPSKYTHPATYHQQDKEWRYTVWTQIQMSHTLEVHWDAWIMPSMPSLATFKFNTMIDYHRKTTYTKFINLITFKHIEINHFDGYRFLGWLVDCCIHHGWWSISYRPLVRIARDQATLSWTYRSVCQVQNLLLSWQHWSLQYDLGKKLIHCQHGWTSCCRERKTFSFARRP